MSATGRSLIGEQQNVLNDVEVINRQMILTYSQDASDHAYLYGLDGKQIREIGSSLRGQCGIHR